MSNVNIKIYRVSGLFICCSVENSLEKCMCTVSFEFFENYAELLLITSKNDLYLAQDYDGTWYLHLTKPINFFGHWASYVGKIYIFQENEVNPYNLNTLFSPKKHTPLYFYEDI